MKRLAFFTAVLMLMPGGLAAQTQPPGTSGDRSADETMRSGNSANVGNPSQPGNRGEPGTVGQGDARGAGEERAGSSGVVTSGGTGAADDRGNNH